MAILTAAADPKPAVEVGLLPLFEQLRRGLVGLRDVGGARLAMADGRGGTLVNAPRA